MPDEQVIQVQGHGEVEAAPDIAVIHLGVVSREAAARAAILAASERMGAIIAAVQGQGVPDRDIQTMQFNLHLDLQSNVYVASHQVAVRSEDVTRAGAILDAAVGEGAKASAGIHFALADRAEPEDRALELAVADARRKAETLASALGVAIDRVGQVTVVGRGMAHDVPGFAKRPSYHAPELATPIEAGQLRITADVQVTYRFR